MSNKQKNVSTNLNYIVHVLILASSVTGCISISFFALSVRIPIGNTSSTPGLNVPALTSVTKMYKSIINKK